MGACGSTENAVPPAHKALQSVVQTGGDVRDYYTFDKQLGKGNFGIVHLVFNKKTNEQFACKSISKVMRTVVSVVHHCHTMNVVHRDLKPENFLLTEKGTQGVIKATDFGLSRFFKDGDNLDEIVGSPFYALRNKVVLKSVAQQVKEEPVREDSNWELRRPSGAIPSASPSNVSRAAPGPMTVEDA
ncbi:Calcium-dependent protein kinase 17 [Tetrabaena socialis]|uniref:Calcium-dependent protein kinase 17 n=1 Tax=Tetrabaena socialis TaxID=47790 RepID=A0A2J8AF44_9CHLO|nr:Calcium-dependent protein kinase 17 [Tetrabaena socialis]|eukprot:PNH11143.1 Calcium-dependent protein kinase 17 [Tetrabaena socialis]